MPELEARLRALGPAAFPPTPDLAGAVAARLRAGGAHAAEGERSGAAVPRRLPVRRGLAVALAALAVPVGAVAAVPATRHAVLDWLGLRHVRVERVQRLPTLPGLQRADLGTKVASVRAASERAGFAVRVPRALGRPDAIYEADGVVSLLYEEVLVTELEALDEPDLLKKALGPGTDVVPVSVDGAPGVFISGAPHEVLYAPRDGGPVRPLPPRLAGNALAFERDGLVVRIEGPRLGKARALELARSLTH